ncbi:MAG: AIR synthase-related protein, partial [Thermoplasmatales archaeon]
MIPSPLERYDIEPWNPLCSQDSKICLLLIRTLIEEYTKSGGAEISWSRSTLSYGKGILKLNYIFITIGYSQVVNLGKAGLKEISAVLKKNSDSILKTNVVGSDFSFFKYGKTNLVFKIEPMIFYKSLTIQENALLSVLVPINDFSTSGTWPSIAMIDFEKPVDVGEEFFDYVDAVFQNLRDRRIKVASGHTGSYGNLGYGVAGTMALVGFKRPIFSFKRIKEDDSYYSVGKLGAELSFFKHKKEGSKADSPLDLSIEKYVKEFIKIRSIVHYIHDISEGGLMRALGEVSALVRSGFNVSSQDVENVAAKGTEEYGARVFSASSSGALIVAVDSKRKKEFEKVIKSKSWPILEIKKR